MSEVPTIYSQETFSKRDLNDRLTKRENQLDIEIKTASQQNLNASIDDLESRLEATRRAIAEKTIDRKFDQFVSEQSVSSRDEKQLTYDPSYLKYKSLIENQVKKIVSGDASTITIKDEQLEAAESHFRTKLAEYSELRENFLDERRKRINSFLKDHKAYRTPFHGTVLVCRPLPRVGNGETI